MKRLKQVICLCLASFLMVRTVFAAPVDPIQEISFLMTSSDAVCMEDPATPSDAVYFNNIVRDAVPPLWMRLR